MTRRLLITASILALTAGCSSSSGSGTTPDSGTTTENDSSTAMDSGVTTGDDGGTTDTGTVTQGDTGTVTQGDTGTTGDAGACVAATSVTVPPYEPTVKKSACSAADVGAFITACGSGSQSACQAWYANATYATCGDCISPAADSGAGDNSGALLVDSAGNAYLNTAACLAATDGNTNCAEPLTNLQLCELDSCDSVACQMDMTGFQNCQTAADSLGCTAQVTALNGAAQCGTDAADGGDLATNGKCDPSATNGAQSIIYAVCGNGQ